MKSVARWNRSSRVTAIAAMMCAAMLTVGVTGAQAKGGTAKPPVKNAATPFVVQPNIADPADNQTHGFDVTGFIQKMTVDTTSTQCPSETDASRFGGTVTLNNVTLVVPCNLVVQMPANTLKWSEFAGGTPNLALAGGPFPSFELQVVGNSVNGTRIAGLMYASQQSVNAGSGFITSLDYANGSMKVSDGIAAAPGAPPTETVIQINDPKITAAGDPANGTGRHSAGQSPDPRFSVDQANPTIHAGTGYPMCIPRTDPTTKDDPLCPQRNRPARKDTTVNGAIVPAIPSCRLFGVAGVPLPASGELSQTPANQYCSEFVMPDPTGASLAEPTAKEQAPFEVGDFVNYAGTLFHSTSGGPDYISAHTIEANVGIYTQPGKLPSYVAIGEFGVGTADTAATAINGAGQETQDRIFLEAETTDIQSPVDIYYTDVDSKTGAVRNRWVTPFEMTGENQAGNPSGGITTQFAGPQPQRARIRATKAVTGLLNVPSRTVRIANRATCAPTAPTGPVNTTDGTIPATGAVDTCLNSPAALFANGLAAGQYTAPVFEYIFPENVRPGDALVPNDLWHLGFLKFGEGATAAAGTGNPIGPNVGPLTPAPW